MTPIPSTDKDALNRAFAERVAGYKRLSAKYPDHLIEPGTEALVLPPPLGPGLPSFTESADVLLPYAKKYPRIRMSLFAGGWLVELSADPNNHGDAGAHRAYAKEFEVALCIALLRAHGVEVAD